MTARFGLTARFWLAAAAGSMLYLRPANLDFCSAYAAPPDPDQFTAKAVCRDFRARFEKFGHIDFDHPTAFAAGLTGVYTAGLIAPVPHTDGKIRATFETDPTVDWKDQLSPTTLNVLGIDFPVTGLTGFAACGIVTTGGSILKTVDGGTTWTEVFASPTALLDIDMIDESTGWAVGVNGTVLMTSDGGATWTPQVTDGTSIHSSVAAVDAQTAFIASNLGVIFRSVVVAGVLSWVAIPSGAGAGHTGTVQNLLEVNFLDAMTGLAVGNNGTIIKTSDGGSSWAVLPSGVGAHLKAVAIHDASTAWVAGNAGTILHTTDGGASWTAQASGTAVSLNALAFSDDGLVGYVAGNGGVLRATCDAGLIWASDRVAGAANLNDIVYLPDAAITAPPNSGYAMGFAAGNGGIIKERIRSGVLITTPWTHADAAKQARQMHDPGAGDTAGSHHWTHNGFIRSKDTAGEWFNDVPGKNMSTIIDMVFNKVGSGASAYYQCGSETFFPIDDMLFDVGYVGHNDLFTVEGQWTFQYDAADGQYFSAAANADVWVFINDHLVIDMGGTHDATWQYVDLDRLGLSDGSSYRIKAFFAYRQRHVDYAIKIATNVFLTNATLPTINDAKD